MLGENAMVTGAELHLPRRALVVPIDKPLRSLRWLRRFCNGFRSATAASAAQEGLLRLAELVSCGLCCLLLSGKGAQVFAANHGLPLQNTAPCLLQAPGDMAVFGSWHYDNLGDLCALGPITSQQVNAKLTC